MGYVPDGLSKDQWAAMKRKEKDAAAKKKAFQGTSGMQFRSRSFEDYVKGREDGTLKPNMPVFNAAARLKSGEIKPEDIPYMQRPGGRPDGSDLKKKPLFGWMAKKEEPLNPAFKAESTVQGRARKAGVSNDAQMWIDAGAMSAKEAARQARRGQPKIDVGQVKEKKGWFR